MISCQNVLRLERKHTSPAEFSCYASFLKLTAQKIQINHTVLRATESENECLTLGRKGLYTKNDKKKVVKLLEIVCFKM